MTAISILLVEDNPDDEIFIVRTLNNKNITRNITVVRDGREALDFLFCSGKYSERDPGIMPKVVLLDLALPKINGFQVLKHIRDNKKTILLPVVIFSSSDKMEDVRDCYALGANSYIQKPVNMEEFTETLTQIGYYWLSLNEAPPF